MLLCVEVRNLGGSSDRCLDCAIGRHEKKKPVGLYGCHGSGGNQVGAAPAAFTLSTGVFSCEATRPRSASTVRSAKTTTESRSHRIRVMSRVEIRFAKRKSRLRSAHTIPGHAPDCAVVWSTTGASFAARLARSGCSAVLRHPTRKCIFYESGRTTKSPRKGHGV